MINSLIYAKVLATYTTVEEVAAVLIDPMSVRAEVPWPAEFLAGRRRVEYQRKEAVRGLGRCPTSSSVPTRLLGP